MYKQIIIVRKDLHMSAGKLAAQVSHGSMAFLTTAIRNNLFPRKDYQNEIDCYRAEFDLEKDLVEQWIQSAFTKVVLQAKNKNQLMKAVEMAKELGMKEGEDYFLIKDNCYTELEPEEIDENGVGRTLTCIGFKPMDAEIIDKIGKKFHVFEGEVI